MATARPSQPKRQDRTLYCQRCGVAFLWVAEEQRDNSTPPVTNDGAATMPVAASSQASRGNPAPYRAVRPSLCPGCSRIVPPSGRERGLVKWYNRRKRFGFITRKDQPDLFVHGSALADKRPLLPDELVEFSISENDQGLTAAHVVRLASEERRGQETNPVDIPDATSPTSNTTAPES